MFKVEDILARLQNGEDANDIANEMVNALNTANDQFQKEEEAKAKAAEAKETEKLIVLQDIIDLIHEFCIEYYCDNEEDVNTVNAAFSTLNAKSVNKMIEEAGAYAVRMSEMQKHMDTLLNGIFDMPTVKKVPKKGAPAPETRTADVVIGDFLSSMGLK